MQGKGIEKESILEKARQLCIQLYIDEGVPITEKVLSDKIQKVHKDLIKRFHSDAVE